MENSTFYNLPPSPNPVLTPVSLTDGTGIIFERLPQQLSNQIDLELKSLTQSNPKKANEYLAGHIEKEFIMPPFQELTNYLNNKAIKYSEIYPREINDLISKISGVHPNLEKQINKNPKDMWERGILTPEKCKYQISELWVNLQEKYEYNPMHTHAGLYSFVIWHYIPYLMEDEKKFGPGKSLNSRGNHNGKFHFFYCNRSVQSVDIPIDKKWNGMMAIFPSWLHHEVRPFYSSDEFRVTVAGNIFLELKY
jgi:hypothetical protein|tara:strand:- start:843 stop:1595 length:753 start_codon:yes stop_codon:yes gene_type:complete